MIIRIAFSYCSKEYRKEILYPVLQHIARRLGQPDLYEGLISELDRLVVPHGVSEMELKMRQVNIMLHISLVISALVN